MYRKFASIAHSDKYGYSYDSDKWEYRADPFLSQKFRMFETFGDGLIQHSHDWPVTEDFAIDYLFSLAQAMLADEELAESAYYRFTHNVSSETLKFAASLIFNPNKDKEYDKRRYFSMTLLKVTRDREKQHDNRYRELTEYQDGTPKSILALISQEYSDGLERWQNANCVREWCGENLKNGWMDLPAVQLKWFNSDHNKAREFRDAFEACESAGKWLRIRKNSMAGVENYKSALERATEAAR